MKKPMKWNENFIYLTLAYFFINAAFIFHATSMNGGSSLGYIYILPVFWLIFIIGAGFFAYNKRKTLFDKKTKKSSILLLSLCTPIPYIIIVQIFGLILMMF